MATPFAPLLARSRRRTPVLPGVLAVLLVIGIGTATRASVGGATGSDDTDALVDDSSAATLALKGSREGLASIFRLDDGFGTVRDSIFANIRPFADKVGFRLGDYRVGYWPGERGEIVDSADALPAGFIEVTRANENLAISAHFRLREFLTHDQQGVWPKYLVLRKPLIFKLELVIAELEATGHPVSRMVVMSGFRTPQYNASGGVTTGRSSVSRHMYGDAADVFVDNDRDGRMDDLNGDGRVDYHDAQVIAAAGERVERRYPALVGGSGVYEATRDHGPFTHIDARGVVSRWGLLE